MNSYVDRLLDANKERKCYKTIVAEVLIHYTVYRLQLMYFNNKAHAKEIVNEYPNKNAFPFKASVSLRHLVYLVFLLTIKDKDNLGIFSLCKRLVFCNKYHFIETCYDSNPIISILCEISSNERWIQSTHKNMIEGALCSIQMQKYLPIIDDALSSINQNAIAFLANKETYKEIMSAIYTSKNCEIFIYNSNLHYEDVDSHIEWLIKAKNQVQKLFAKI